MTGQPQQVPPGKPIDWALLARTTGKVLAVAALVFAGLKVYWASEAYGWLVAVALYSGIHLPMCLFATLYAVWFLDTNPRTGTVAVILSILSSLLI